MLSRKNKKRELREAFPFSQRGAHPKKGRLLRKLKGKEEGELMSSVS